MKGLRCTPPESPLGVGFAFLIHQSIARPPRVPFVGAVDLPLVS